MPLCSAGSLNPFIAIATIVCEVAQWVGFNLLHTGSWRQHRSLLPQLSEEDVVKREVALEQVSCLENAEAVSVSPYPVRFLICFTQMCSGALDQQLLSCVGS